MGNRLIPMFPELRPFLEEAHKHAPKGAKYVVDTAYRTKAILKNGRWENCNLRTQFMRLMKRAGVKPWPRLFHAFRASCETDLANAWPIHVVTKWLGNSPKVALKHYLKVREADYTKAAGIESAEPMPKIAAKQRAAIGCTRVQE